MKDRMDVELKLDTRSKLLKAAVQVFAKEGFAGASLRQIADMAGVYRDDIAPLNLYYMIVAASRSIFFAAPELDSRYGIDVFSDEEIDRHIDALTKLFVVPDNKDSSA